MSQTETRDRQKGYVQFNLRGRQPWMCATTAESRFHLSAVHVTLLPSGRVRMVATEGHVMAVVEPTDVEVVASAAEGVAA